MWSSILRHHLGALLLQGSGALGQCTIASLSIGTYPLQHNWRPEARHDSPLRAYLLHYITALHFFLIVPSSLLTGSTPLWCAAIVAGSRAGEPGRRVTVTGHMGACAFRDKTRSRAPMYANGLPRARIHMCGSTCSSSGLFPVELIYTPRHVTCGLFQCPSPQQCRYAQRHSFSVGS